MKILVTGGQGFIGYHLIDKLIELGHEVHSLDDLSTGSEDNKVDGVRYFIGDIMHIGNMDDDFDVVFHLAALSRIQPSFDNPYETFRVNADGTHRVAEFCSTRDCKLIYAGSSSRWHEPTRSPYALSKHMGEEIIQMFERVYDIHAHIARFYNVYGPREIMYGDWAAVIGKWRGRIKKGKYIEIVGDGEQRRDFTHVYDIVDGLIRIMNTDKKPKNSDAWELGRGVSYSINEVADMFIERFGCKKSYIGDQKGNYRRTLRETNEALELLEWSPEHNLEDYIKGL